MAFPVLLVVVGLVAAGVAAMSSKGSSTAPSNQVFQNHLYQITLRFSSTNPAGASALSQRLAQIGWTDIVVQPMKGQDPYVFYVLARWAYPTSTLTDTSDVKYIGLADQTPHIQYDAGMPENIRLAVQTALEVETDPARLRSFAGSLLPTYPASAEALTNKAIILEAMSGQAPAAPNVPNAPQSAPVTLPLPANTLPPVPPVFLPPAIPAPAIPPTMSNPVGGISLANLGAALSQIGSSLGLPAGTLPSMPTMPATPAAPQAPSAPQVASGNPYPGMAAGAAVPMAAKSKTTAHADGQSDLRKFFGAHQVIDPATGAPFPAGSVASDGVIGPVTMKATWLFQNWWNTSRIPATGEARLVTDGLLGPATYAALKKV